MKIHAGILHNPFKIIFDLIVAQYASGQRLAYLLEQGEILHKVIKFIFDEKFYQDSY